MARVQKKPNMKNVGDPTDPYGLLMLMEAYLETLRLKHYTDQTLWGAERYIRECSGQ